MRYRKAFTERQDGYQVINGRPHGFKWKPQWEVTFTFDSEEERKEFIQKVTMGDKD